MSFMVNPFVSFPAVSVGIPTDYIAYYTMTNVSGSTLIDETGTYNMTISGAVVSGDYMDFDGTNDYTESNTIPALTSDCAICFWMIPDAAPNGNTTEYPFQQRQCVGFAHDHPAGTVQGTGIRQKTGGLFDITTPNQAVTDTVNPTFILVMVDGATMYHYEGNTQIGSISIGTALAESTKFNIGCGQSGNGTTRIAFYPGRIKSFRVYDRALISAEISALASEF